MNEGLINSHWDDGTEVTYEKFSEGFPTYDKNINEHKGDCVVLIGEGDLRLEWQNRACDDPLVAGKAVCKKPAPGKS